MSEVDIRLARAISLGLDPKEVSPEGVWFAWYPVYTRDGGWRWLRRVKWFQPLGLLNEYYDL